jgi:hypothetical protein
MNLKLPDSLVITVYYKCPYKLSVLTYLALTLAFYG